MSTLRSARPVWARAGIGAVFLVGLALVAWNGDTLRLNAGGSSMVWPVLVAFGLGWLARHRELWRAGAGLAMGSLAGVAATFLAARWLPLTPPGAAIALAAGAAVVALGVWVAAGAASLGSSIAAYGVGVAAAQMVDVEVTTGVAQVVEVWTATALALALGLVAAELAAMVLSRATTEEHVLATDVPPLLEIETERPMRAGDRRAS